MSGKMKLYCRSQRAFHVYPLGLRATESQNRWSSIINGSQFFLPLSFTYVAHSHELYFSTYTVISQLRTHTSEVTRHFHILRITDLYYFNLKTSYRIWYVYFFMSIFISYNTFISFFKNVIKANIQNMTYVKVKHSIKFKLQSAPLP